MTTENFSLDVVKQTPHHPCIQELSKVLSIRSENEDERFFRTEVAYFICKVATCMQAHVCIKGDIDMPVNAYVLALSPSGSGKGTSIGILEDEVIGGFRDRYIEDTFDYLAEKNRAKLATSIFIRSGQSKDLQDITDGLETRFKELGSYCFTFDSATTPAIKQFKELIGLAGTGALSIAIDEIGSNLLGADEVMKTFLELFDKGKTNSKLVKSSKENQRGFDINAPMPANLLMFGTTGKLLNSGIEEEALYSWLREGYGRRLLFAYGEPNVKEQSIDNAKDSFARRIDPQVGNTISKWNTKFTELADPVNSKFQVEVPQNIGIILEGYRITCKNRTIAIPEQKDIEKAEMMHRHFKALKLAGALAFLDGNPFLTKTELYQAIKLVEEDSAYAFKKLINRDPNYVRLAKYICTCGKEVTHADLTEELPFYPKSSGTQRKELMTLAIAYGSTHNLIIKTENRDKIEVFSGESLEENDLKNCIISCSWDQAYNYTNSYETWEDLIHNLPRAHKNIDTPMSWINHHLMDGDPDDSGQGRGHRQESDCLDEFNLIVLDVDGTTTLDRTAAFLEDYTWCIYTTKSNTNQNDHFRIILPMSHVLKLNTADYKSFMNNVINWMPFTSDQGANQRSRKWNCNAKAIVEANDGKLLNVLPFIPHTSFNNSFNEKQKSISDMGALEKWFYEQIEDGNRNNNLFKYAMMLKDNGMAQGEVEEKVELFNSKLELPLSSTELKETIFKSIAKAYM